MRIFQREGIKMQGAVRDRKLAFARRPARAARVRSSRVHTGADVPAAKFEVFELQFATGGKLREKGVAADAGGCQMKLS